MYKYIKPKTKTKLFFCLIVYLVIMVYQLQRLIFMTRRTGQTQNICYSFTEFDILQSIDVLDPKNNSIFFHETSCRGGLTSRQACAVESAAIAHPNRQIYLLFSGPIRNETMLRNVNEFANVHVARIYLNYSLGTSLEIVLDKVYDLSIYPIAHEADVLRFLTLYKWSGIYLDLDTVVARTLDPLGNNWAAKEDSSVVAIGAMAFSDDEVGRSAIRAIVEELEYSYQPMLWNHNGNGAIIRAFKRYCNVSKQEEISTPRCKGFQLYNPDVIYPLHWMNAQEYFEEGDLFSDETENAYIYHMWNQLTENSKIEDGSPYSMLAKRYCPNTYSSFWRDFGKKSFNIGQLSATL